MTACPWFKLYARQLLGHPALHGPSRRTARSLLVELMCLAHAQADYGRIPAGTLAGYLAGDPDGTLALDYLDQAGVINRVGTDIVFRTLIHEREIADRGRKDRERRGDLTGSPAGNSRARARSDSDSDSGSSEPKTSKKPSKRKETGSPATAARGTTATRAWDEAFRRVHGTECGWPPGDLKAIAEVARFPGATPEEITRRALKLLRSEDPWLVKRQTPRGLRDEWNRWPPAKPDPAPEPPPFVHPELEDAVRSLRTTLFQNGAAS